MQTTAIRKRMEAPMIEGSLNKMMAAPLNRSIALKVRRKSDMM
jgi:hypothetical protein